VLQNYFSQTETKGEKFVLAEEVKMIIEECTQPDIVKRLSIVEVIKKLD